MRTTIIATAIAAMLLSGCNDPVADAQTELQMARRVGLPDDQCRAARKLRDAYLAAHDEINYGLAGVEADQVCHAAEG